MWRYLTSEANTVKVSLRKMLTKKTEKYSVSVHKISDERSEYGESESEENVDKRLKKTTY
jgi:hypothetical protein